MKNEPVAWMELYKGKPNNLAFNKFDVLPEPPDWTVVPLYTHPVKEQDESFDRTASHMAGEYVSYPVKELTDEEILDTFDPHFDVDIEDKELIKFARAILRKAQEKWTINQ